MKNTSKIAGIAAALLLAACGGKQVNPGKTLKTTEDSFSYSIGYQIGKFMKGSGVEKIDYSSMVKGIEEAMKKDSGYAISEKNIQRVQNDYIAREREKKAKVLKEEANKWMADNAKKSGVVKLTSNGQYKESEAGKGAVPGKFDTVTCHIVVKNTKGKVIYNSRERNPQGMITDLSAFSGTPALLEAFERSAAGSKFEVYSPMDGQGGSSIEEAYGISIFEVEFVSVKPGKQPKGE